jgi:hypothetical protein
MSNVESDQAWQRFVMLCSGLTPQQLQIVSSWIDLTLATRGRATTPVPGAPPRLGTGPLLKVV